MDIDVDLDAELLNKLNTMGTRDHEDLVAQFQSIVGSQISPAGCAFYLEMANWFVVAPPLLIYTDYIFYDTSIPNAIISFVCSSIFAQCKETYRDKSETATQKI